MPAMNRVQVANLKKPDEPWETDQNGEAPDPLPIPPQTYEVRVQAVITRMPPKGFFDDPEARFEITGWFIHTGAAFTSTPMRLKEKRPPTTIYNPGTYLFESI